MKKSKLELKVDLLIDLQLACLWEYSQKGQLVKDEFKRKLQEIEDE